jgi:hypothetical protein
MSNILLFSLTPFDVSEYTYVPEARRDASNLVLKVPGFRSSLTSVATSLPNISYTFNVVYPAFVSVNWISVDGLKGFG